MYILIYFNCDKFVIYLILQKEKIQLKPGLYLLRKLEKY